MEKLTFIDLDYNIDILNENYTIIYVNWLNELHQKLIMANRVSVLECINKDYKPKLLIINDNVTNEKGFWTNLENIKSSIPIYIQVLCLEDIPPNFIKKSIILIKEHKVEIKRKISRKVIHKYREFMLDLNYIEAFVKINFDLLEKYKRKYLL
tara:strand:+ start:239 stop:697 length:459 start_codon:yes stop_codon:yes gene_type:complete